MRGARCELRRYEYRHTNSTLAYYSHAPPNSIRRITTEVYLNDFRWNNSRRGDGLGRPIDIFNIPKTHNIQAIAKPISSLTFTHLPDIPRPHIRITIPVFNLNDTIRQIKQRLTPARPPFSVLACVVNDENRNVAFRRNTPATRVEPLHILTLIFP